MYFLALFSIFILVSCEETNTHVIGPEDHTKKPEPPKTDLVENEDEAKALINLVSNNASKPRRLDEIALQWKPKSKAEITGYFNPTNDPARAAVIDSIPAGPITRALGFYHAANVGGAFANTFESLKEFEYRGQKSKFAEFFFQADKISQFGAAEYKGNFAKSFNAVVSLKQNIGWGAFPQKVKTLLPPQFDFLAWDAVAVDVMSQIHAARFKVEPDLFLTLVSTKANSVIVEDAQANDANWGNGGNGNGKNMLGLLYMTHRQRFWYAFRRENKKFFNAKSPEDVAWMLRWLKDYDGTTK